ncbi:PolC-type DNA polymerase III [Mycoplasma corogypsi]|uniref:PolC-type DNA polymerase III n=1 Tax=Mycoplasma corogypsi TaxID=2106 RepID=UPI0038735537
MGFIKDDALRKLLIHLELDQQVGYEDAFIKPGFRYIPKENGNTLQFTVVFPMLPNPFCIYKLIKKLKSLNQTGKTSFSYDFSIEIQNYIVGNTEFRTFLFEYINLNQDQFPLMHKLAEQNTFKFQRLSHSYVLSVSKELVDDKNLNDEVNKFKNEIFHLGVDGFLVLLSEKTNADPVSFLSSEELEKHAAKQVSLEERNNNSANITPSNKLSTTKPNFVYRKTTTGYQSWTISELLKQDTNIIKNVVVKALIFKNELVKHPKGTFFKYSVTDMNEAMEVSDTWWNNVVKKHKKELIPKNTWVEIYGDFHYSMASKNSNTMTKRLEVTEIVVLGTDEQKITDDAPKKRVELNAKSKMNTQDSLMTATEIVNAAKELGHKAVAILDSNSVQSFPELEAAAKKAGIKPIYGAAFDFTEQNNNAILNPNFTDANLSDLEIIAFDIETTSLSPHSGDIIEFGATVVKNNTIESSHQFFIKCGKKLSNYTIELTNIDDNMLEKEGLSKLEGLKKIHSILNGKVVIAHNAEFDINFIIQKLSEVGLELENTVCIDSLMVSHLNFPEKAKHRLGSFCSYVDVEYDETKAHRADYDAEVLARAWMAVVGKMKNEGIITLNDLYNWSFPKFYNHRRTNQVSVIVKNQAGLKQLFNLISFALADRLVDEGIAKGPKIYLSDIPRDGNLLVSSGGLRGKLIKTMLYSCDERLEKEIQDYDYIEIPRLEAFVNFVGSDDFTSEQIKARIKKLIELAEKYGKKVVAIGDVRHKVSEDSIFYKMLVYAKGVDSIRHFLYDGRKAAAKTLNIPDLFYPNTEQMLDSFSWLNNEQLVEDIVINNTNYIADLIDDNIQVIKKDLYTPVFDNSKQKLVDLVYQTAKQTYGENLPKEIQKRIEAELVPIVNNGFDVVYWIAHKLVKMSNDAGFIVGSRGSVGSSFVATMSGITEVNPLSPHYYCPNCKSIEFIENHEVTTGYDLPDKYCDKCQTKLIGDGHDISFATFLGFNAEKVPDIDLNFSGIFQDKVHDEVKRLFGDNHTIRAGTISTIKDKSGANLVFGNSKDHGWGFSNLFCDFLGSKLEGVKKTTGKHPGGILVIPKEYDTEDFTPTNYPANKKDEWKTSHIEYNYIHDNVLKLDILGHVDPTAVTMLQRLTGIDVKKDISTNDKKVLSIFTSTDVFGITSDQIGGEKTGALGLPEFGTDFVRGMLSEAKPKTFADLISLAGLSHGEEVWNNNAQILVMEQGKQLKDVICCRDDIMNQLISQGVDDSEAFKIMESVRKGKGITETQENMLREKGVEDWYIESMKKIKYLFPKAHATAYVIMAWRIAWFKVYKPLEYYATFFTHRVDQFDIETMKDDIGAQKINNKLEEIRALPMKERNNAVNKELTTTLTIARELYARGFKISNIDINKSLATEWLVDYKNNSLIPPFNAISGLGEAVAQKIVSERDIREYTSVEDFQKRSKVNKKQYDSIKELKALDGFKATDQITLF